MTQYEYEIIDLQLPADLSEALARAMYGTPLPPEARRSINEFVKKQLNELGKKGWLMHNSGLTTLPTLVLYKVKGAK
jgi:hypothetical protein